MPPHRSVVDHHAIHADQPENEWLNPYRAHADLRVADQDPGLDHIAHLDFGLDALGRSLDVHPLLGQFAALDLATGLDHLGDNRFGQVGIVQGAIPVGEEGPCPLVKRADQAQHRTPLRILHFLHPVIHVVP